MMRCARGYAQPPSSWARLVRLEEDGPGAKVSRADVLGMFARYRLAPSAPAVADHSAIAQRGK
jgi:hypothetical protein